MRITRGASSPPTTSRRTYIAFAVFYVVSLGFISRSNCSFSAETTSETLPAPPAVHINVRRTNAIINQQLIQQLYKGKDPFSVQPPVGPDWSYHSTNIDETFISILFEKYLSTRLSFLLEVGSFKAGSITRIASYLKESLSINWKNISLVCIDPFTGDTNMWFWQDNGRRNLTGVIHNYLDTDEAGYPRIAQRFRANVLSKGHADMIIPIQASGLVGMKLLKRLYTLKLLESKPQMIYLDAAHEPDETYLELKEAYDLLQECGILLGDDYTWGWYYSVVTDCNRFASEQNLTRIVSYFPEDKKFDQPVDGLGVLHDAGQWFIVKPRENGEPCL